MKRSSQIMPKKFYGDDVIDDVTGWPQSFSLYLCLGEVGSGSKLQGKCLVNKCQYRNFLSRLYMPKDDLNELHFSRLQVKVNITGLLGDLGTNKQHCKLSFVFLTDLYVPLSLITLFRHSPWNCYDQISLTEYTNPIWTLCKAWRTSRFMFIMMTWTTSYMMTPSNGSLSALMGLCAWNTPVNGEFSSQRASNTDFYISLMWVPLSS